MCITVIILQRYFEKVACYRKIETFIFITMHLEDVFIQSDIAFNGIIIHLKPNITMTLFSALLFELQPQKKLFWNQCIHFHATEKGSITAAFSQVLSNTEVYSIRSTEKGTTLW